MRPPRLCVVGSFVADMIMRVDRPPGRGETVVGRAFHLGSGGKGANQALMAARLGASVQMVGRVGRDPLGDMLIDGLRREGVDCTHVGRGESPSGAATVLVDAGGSNYAAVALGANLDLTPEAVQLARPVIESADLLLCQNELRPETTRAALELGRAVGSRTLWNPAPVAGANAANLTLVDILVVNEHEAAVLSGRAVAPGAEPEIVAGLRALGPSLVVLTLGARGALALGEAGEVRVEGVPVAAVDETGAGDAFTGALAVALARGSGLDRAMREANLAGALTASRLGTQAAFPTARELAETRAG